MASLGHYVTRTGQRVIVVRVFVKKTEKTPRGKSDCTAKAKDIV
jgi:phage-related protein